MFSGAKAADWREADIPEISGFEARRMCSVASRRGQETIEPVSRSERWPCLSRPARTACRSGRAKGRQSNQRNWRDEGDYDDVEQPNCYPAQVCERNRRDGGSVFPARPNTGDLKSPFEDSRLMRSDAR